MLTNAYHTVTWTQLRSGQKDALLDLYNQHYTGLVNYGIKLTGDRELAVDCFTQVLLRLWDSRAKLPAVENVRSYLLTCLRREMMLHLKQHNGHAGKQTRLQEGENEFSYEDYLVQLQHNEELKQRLAKAMESLTPREKELLRLKFFEDIDYDEIAHRCSITKRTAYNIIHQALKTLKKSLLHTYQAAGISVPHPAILTVFCCLLFL